MQLALKVLDQENLTIEPALDAGALAIRFDGSCDGFAVTALGNYLEHVLLEMTRLSLTTVEFDVRAVRLLNSSCLKQFITFLHRVRSDEVLRQVDFVVDPEQPWQSRSLRAFVRMCPGIVSVVPIPRSGSSAERFKTG